MCPGEISGVWVGGEHYGCEEGTGEALKLGLGGSGQAQDGCIGVCAEESTDMWQEVVRGCPVHGAVVNDTVRTQWVGGRRIGDTCGEGEVSGGRGSSVEGEEDQSRMCRDTGIGFLAAFTSPVSPWAGCIMVRVLWVEGPIHLV